jgi:UDP-N-acetylglucosamine 2-epimerase
MPEEINRIITDHLADVLLCPTETAAENLRLEGIVKGVHLVGDVMYDALWDTVEQAKQTSTILDRLDLVGRAFILATVHRAENTDQPWKLQEIMDALLTLTRSGQIIVFPVHPRTRKELEKLSFQSSARLILTDPLSYIDMVMLETSARIILTDSGGVQKEAYWLRVPCITLREETEWVETVVSGWNRLVGTDSNRIVRAVDTIAALRNSAWSWKRGDASKTVARLVATCP